MYFLHVFGKHLVFIKFFLSMKGIIIRWILCKLHAPSVLYKSRPDNCYKYLKVLQMKTCVSYINFFVLENTWHSIHILFSNFDSEIQSSILWENVLSYRIIRVKDQRSNVSESTISRWHWIDTHDMVEWSFIIVPRS